MTRAIASDSVRAPWMTMLDDMMNAGGVDVMVDVQGTAAGIKLFNPEKFYTAMIGPLRDEPILGNFGTQERTEFVERCRVSILDVAAAQLALDAPVVVVPFTTGDASVEEGQRFTVERIERVSGRWTTVALVRPKLAKVQARGTEIR